MSLDITELDSLTITDTKEAELVAYIVGRVDPWEKARVNGPQKRWDEYYRMWRGIPNPQTKKSQVSTLELSKAVMPVMQQAVETIVAEAEEATFGRKQWLIFEDEDVTDVDPQMAEARSEALQITNTRFLDDCDEEDVPAHVSESFLNGALYGTAIGKVVVNQRTEFVPADLEGGLLPKNVIRVGLEPISPYEFVIDPTARTIGEAEGCAHVCMRPLHKLWRAMDDGVYNQVDNLEAWDGGNMMASGAPGELRRADTGTGELQEAHIIEYHGLVPANLIPGAGGGDDTNLVEVIVTIANKERVLRAIRNPFPMDDRSFVAYQHDTVPGEFWGRGPTEKGYWAQKVLDAEVSARISALAYSSHPMMITDATKMIQRGQKLGVRPGRNILANGNPNEVMAPVKFPGPDANTWRQASEMERMVEMSTGSFAVATSSINERGSTATGASISQATTVKRSKRTMSNIERRYLGPFVKKALLRYTQFDSPRYPMAMVGSLKFTVNATMGIMARELEQQQLTQMLSTVPGGTPAYWLVLQSIYSNSSLQDKEKLENIAEMMFEQTSNPPPPEPDLGGIARIEGVKQREREHEDRMALENRKLDQQEDENFKDRRLDMAKSASE